MNLKNLKSKKIATNRISACWGSGSASCVDVFRPLITLQRIWRLKERMGGMYECLWGQDSSNVMSGADWTL